MRILYFTSNYEPHNNAAAVRSSFLIKTLRDEGFDVTSLSANTTHANKRFFFHFPTNKKSAVTRLLGQIICGMELFVRVLFSRYDKYLFSTPPFITVIFGAVACWIKGGKYFLDVRDIYPEVFYELKLIKANGIASKALNFLTTLTYKRSDHIFTTSQGQLDQVLKYDDSVSVSVMRNGFDSEIFSPSSDKFENFTVTFHGNLGHFQDIKLLLKVAEETYKKSPSIKFLVIGDGPHKQKIAEYKLPNLEYLGQLEFENINEIISKAHLGLSLRTDDLISNTAIPVKLYEYVGVGIPVIQAPQSEATDIINQYSLGFGLSPGCSSEISDKIIEIYENKSLYNNFIEHLAKYREHLTRKESAKVLLHQLRNLNVQQKVYN